MKFKFKLSKIVLTEYVIYGFYGLEAPERISLQVPNNMDDISTTSVAEALARLFDDSDEEPSEVEEAIREVLDQTDLVTIVGGEEQSGGEEGMSTSSDTVSPVDTSSTGATKRDSLRELLGRTWDFFTTRFGRRAQDPSERPPNDVDHGSNGTIDDPISESMSVTSSTTTTEDQPSFLRSTISWLGSWASRMKSMVMAQAWALRERTVIDESKWWFRALIGFLCILSIVAAHMIVQLGIFVPVIALPLNSEAAGLSENLVFFIITDPCIYFIFLWPFVATVNFLDEPDLKCSWSLVAQSAAVGVICQFVAKLAFTFILDGNDPNFPLKYEFLQCSPFCILPALFYLRFKATRDASEKRKAKHNCYVVFMLLVYACFCSLCGWHAVFRKTETLIGSCGLIALKLVLYWIIKWVGSQLANNISEEKALDLIVIFDIKFAFSMTDTFGFIKAWVSLLISESSTIFSLLWALFEGADLGGKIVLWARRTFRTERNVEVFEDDVESGTDVITVPDSEASTIQEEEDSRRRLAMQEKQRQLYLVGAGIVSQLSKVISWCHKLSFQSLSLRVGSVSKHSYSSMIITAEEFKENSTNIGTTSIFLTLAMIVFFMWSLYHLIPQLDGKSIKTRRLYKYLFLENFWLHAMWFCSVGAFFLTLEINHFGF